MLFFLKIKKQKITTFIFIMASLTLSSFSWAGQTLAISQSQLLSMQSAPSSPTFIILDVRSKQEYEEAHIAGAINISHDTINENLAVLSKQQDSMVIVHCRSGRRAAKAEEILIKNGFNVRHLAGDMNAWQAKKLPLVTGQ